MSSQPSTMDNIRSTAASATQSVADTLDPAKNQESGTTNSSSKEVPQDSSGDKSFKQQLDEAAYNYAPQGGEEKKNESLVEKEQTSEGDKKPEDTDSSFMPKRPENDLHVEEFLKEQYKSTGGAGMADVKE